MVVTIAKSFGMIRTKKYKYSIATNVHRNGHVNQM